MVDDDRVDIHNRWIYRAYISLPKMKGMFVPERLHQPVASEGSSKAALQKALQREESLGMPKPSQDGFVILRNLGRNQGQFAYKAKVSYQSEFLVSEVKVVLMDYPSDLLLLQGSAIRSIEPLSPSNFETITYRFDVKDERCVGRNIHADVSF